MSTAECINTHSVYCVLLLAAVQYSAAVAVVSVEVVLTVVHLPVLSTFIGNRSSSICSNNRRKIPVGLSLCTVVLVYPCVCAS